MANTTVKGKFNVVAENGDVQTIYPKTTGDQVLVDRSSNASVIPNDVANLQHIVNKMGSLALKSKVETSDFTTGTMINSIADLKSNTETGKIADATVVKDIESRVDTLENSNLVTVDELDAGLATKPDTEINDSVTSTSLTWSSKKLSDQLTTLNSNSNLLKSRVDNLSTLQEGSTTGDAELIGIRTGYDGTNYPSAGEAVQTQISDLHNSVNQLNDVIYNESTEYIEVIDELTILTGNGLIVWDKVDDVYNIAALDQNNRNNTYTIGCTVKPGEQIKIKCISYYNNYTGAGIIFSDSTESIPLWNDSISIIPTSNYDCFAGNTSSAWKKCEYEVTVPERAKTVWVRGSNSDTTKIFKNKVIYNSKIPSKTSDLINDSNFIMDKKLPVICFDFDELRNNIDSRFTILKSYGFTGNVVDSNNIEVTQKLVKMGFDISPYIGNHSNFDYISDSNGKLQQNIIEKMTRLRNYGLYNPIMISCSGHKDSEMLEEYLYENYDVKFIRARSFYKKDGTYEYMYPSGNSLIRRIISPIIMEGNRTVDEINDEIDMLVNNNVPIIMPMMHAFSSDGGSSDISEENYEKIVMHVKDLVDDGLVLCMNMMEYYKYRYPDEYANFIRGQTMSNDTRLENICVGYDDTVYDSPGKAVRTQFTSTKAQTESVKKAISSVEPDVIAFFYDLSVGGYTASGAWNDTSAVYKKLRTYKEFIDLELFDKISIKMTGDTSNIKVSVFYYDSDYNLIGYDGSPTAWEHWYKLASEIKPNNSHADSTRYVKMMFSNYDENTFNDFPDNCSIAIIGHGFTNANTICVSSTGDGDFYTITEAVKVANDSSGHPVNIFIKSGEYKESIRTTVSGVRNRYLNFIGENVNTVRWYMTTGQYLDAPLWTDAECHIENITFEMNDSEAPTNWVPGTSQTERQNMLPGYALHIDGKVGTSDITTTSVKNCKCISNCNSACGCGNHMNQILLFENTYFEYTKQEKYDGIATEGGLCVHSAQNPQYMHDQYVVVKDCVSTGSGNVSAIFNMSLNGGDDAVCSFINNSFWADGTGQNGVTYLKGSSTLKGISHGNNCENLNA